MVLSSHRGAPADDRQVVKVGLLDKLTFHSAKHPGRHFILSLSPRHNGKAAHGFQHRCSTRHHFALSTVTRVRRTQNQSTSQLHHGSYVSSRFHMDTATTRFNSIGYFDAFFFKSLPRYLRDLAYWISFGNSSPTSSCPDLILPVRPRGVLWRYTDPRMTAMGDVTIVRAPGKKGEPRLVTSD